MTAQSYDPRMPYVTDDTRIASRRASVIVAFRWVSSRCPLRDSSLHRAVRFRLTVSGRRTRSPLTRTPAADRPSRKRDSDTFQ